MKITKQENTFLTKINEIDRSNMDALTMLKNEIHQELFTYSEKRFQHRVYTTLKRDVNAQKADKKYKSRIVQLNIALHQVNSLMESYRQTVLLQNNQKKTRLQNSKGIK